MRSIEIPRNDIWSNEDHIGYIVERVKQEHADLRVRRERHLLGMGRRTDHELTDVKNPLSLKHGYVVARSLSEEFGSVQDNYVRLGVGSYFNNFDKIGEYLLTPNKKRTVVESQRYGYIVPAIGAISLAARASGQEIRMEFNNVIISAEPEKHPLSVYSEFIDDGITMAERASNALACSSV